MLDKWTIQQKNIFSNILIIFRFFFCFTPYPAQLAKRLRFPYSTEFWGIACWLAEPHAAHCLVIRAAKWIYYIFLSPDWESNSQPSRLDWYVCASTPLRLQNSIFSFNYTNSSALLYFDVNSQFIEKGYYRLYVCTSRLSFRLNTL